MHKWLLLAVSALVVAMPMRGEPAPAEVIAHNRQVVAQANGAAGVFAVEDDGTVRHVQSGLICPADFPNVHLVSVQVFAADGSDVGCDYGRFGSDRLAVSKLTIFATKAPPGMTLDDVYSLYDNEIMRSYPDARPEKPADVKMTDKSGNPRTDYRAGAYSITFGSTPMHSELIVGLVNGWMLEVRASYANAVVQVGDTTSKEEIDDQAGDIASPYLAFTWAQNSLEAKTP